jgi:hypothetical protein
MSRSISEAATGSTEIARNIAGVAQAAEHTTTGANDSQCAAAELARMASQLQSLVGDFQIEQRESDAATMLRQAMEALEGTAGNGNASQLDQLRVALRGLITANSSGA